MTEEELNAKANGCAFSVLKIYDIFAGLICAVFFFYTFFGDRNVKGIILYLICTFIFFLLPLAATFQAGQEYKNNLNNTAASGFPKMELNCEHFEGLPMSRGEKCSLVFGEANISVSAASGRFRIAYSKIYNVEVRTETEIQKQYVSSAGGAVAGAIMFGAVGAAICGRIKEKNSVQRRHYLIISYDKEGKTEYIAFDVTLCSGTALKYANVIKKRGLITLKPQITDL